MSEAMPAIRDDPMIVARDNQFARAGIIVSRKTAVQFEILGLCLPCDRSSYDPEQWPDLKKALRDGFGVNRVPDLRGRAVVTERTGSRTEILSVHKLRSAARRREHNLQDLQDRERGVGGYELLPRSLRMAAGRQLVQEHVPSWAHGVRYRKAGRFQHVVEATEWRGH